MGKYTGCQCIICQNTFSDDDDIVVCPDCGTPYHRSCYQSEGHCINSSLHAVGGSWQAQQNEVRMKLGGKTCPNCGFINTSDAVSCASCGTSLNEDAYQPGPNAVRIPLPGGRNVYFDAADPCCGASPDEQIEEERLGDVASYVGRNTLYYIPLFRRFRDTGRKISLNLTCILFPYLYFAYRKMWPMAIISALINIACGLPYSMLNMLATLTSKEYTDMLVQLYGDTEAIHMFDGLTAFLQTQENLLQTLGVPLFLFSLGIRLVFCLTANYMYYRHVMGGVGKIRKAAPTQSVRSALLQSEGGASILNVIGCAVLYYFLNVGIYVVLALVFMH